LNLTPVEHAEVRAVADAASSEELIRRFQSGEQEALERLWKRYLPRLKRWAHGRLPSAMRRDANTDDLVQDAFIRSLARMRLVEPRGGQTLFAYFRTVILNQIRNRVRDGGRRPPTEALDTERHMPSDAGPSVLEEMIGRESLELYQRALERLSEDDQNLILAVVELRCTDRELAELFEKPSPDAARMARGRAVARLARAMEAVAEPGSAPEREPPRRP
jgi:RNA polymerase sigma-70 factor (ECF subfamily)